jgi:hypothetical protein
VTASALGRVIERGAADRGQLERCDMCACAVPERHRHAVDTEQAELMCLCRPCALLFERDAASQGHYRLVPERRVRLDGLEPSALGVPVGLAYFVRHADGQVVAHYPSPLGSTTWEIDAGAWQSQVTGCPQLADLAPEVEAVLVNTVRDARERWIVPLDDCFQLIALVGREWTGLSGGSRVWPQIEAFFAGLKEGTHG